MFKRAQNSIPCPDHKKLIQLSKVSRFTDTGWDAELETKNKMKFSKLKTSGL